MRYSSLKGRGQFIYSEDERRLCLRVFESQRMETPKKYFGKPHPTQKNVFNVFGKADEQLRDEIVKAYNAHEELVAVARQVIDIGNYAGDSWGRMFKAIEAARIVLAKIETVETPAPSVKEEVS